MRAPSHTNWFGLHENSAARFGRNDFEQTDGGFSNIQHIATGEKGEIENWHIGGELVKNLVSSDRAPFNTLG